MDDIVTRLRAFRCQCQKPTDTWCVDIHQAADEIERLRLACHFLAGWISCHEHDIDQKDVVATAYEKAGRYV